MGTVKHNIGAQIKLPVEKVVTIKGRKTYIVRYEASLYRVQMFDWQEGQPIPKEIRCRLTSINEFGFPSFEQVPQKEEVSLIEPTKPKDVVSHKNQAQSFYEKYSSFTKKKSPDLDKGSNKQ